MTTDIQNTTLEFNACFIKIDRSNNTKDFNEAVSTCFDNIAQDPLLTEIFCSMEKEAYQRNEKINTLEKESLSFIRKKYTKAKNICSQNGIILTPFRDDLPSIEKFEGHRNYRRIKRLLSMNRFEAYEKNHLQSSDPLIISLNKELESILDTIRNKNVKLPSALTRKCKSFISWQQERKTLHDSPWHSFLWLSHHNQYKSLLSGEISSYMTSPIVSAPIFNLHRLGISQDPQYIKDKIHIEGKNHIKKIYDYISSELFRMNKIKGEALPTNGVCSFTTPSSTTLYHDEISYSKENAQIMLRGALFEPVEKNSRDAKYLELFFPEGTLIKDSISWAKIFMYITTGNSHDGLLDNSKENLLEERKLMDEECNYNSKYNMVDTIKRRHNKLFKPLIDKFFTSCSKLKKHHCPNPILFREEK